MSPILEATPPHGKPARVRRYRRRWRVAAALVIYPGLGFLVAPVIIQWQLRRQLPALTHRQATVQQVRVNPYALSLTVRGLALTETNGTPFAGFDELYVNFQLSSLFRWTWTFSEIRLVGPKANVVRRADGQFNFADLLTHNAPAGDNSPPPPILVQSLSITNALLTFTHGTTPKPFHTVYGPSHLELKNFSTRPNQHGPYAIAATTGAASFTLKLGALVFERGSFGAADQSLGPPFHTRIEEFNGSIWNWTRRRARGAVASASTGPAQPKTERELVREELERRLITTVPVTDEDLRAPLPRRAEVVQRYLVEAGQIAADRLFPVVPKPGEAGKGGARGLFAKLNSA